MDFLTILYFILGLSLLVLVHEFGHYITAKIFGVYVYEFALFMGPKLLQFKGKETKYTLRLLPIGGYCSLAGEEDSQSKRNENELDNEAKEIDEDRPEVPFERTLLGIKNWKKIIIMAAGAFNNILLCFILMFVFFLNSSLPVCKISSSSNLTTTQTSYYDTNLVIEEATISFRETNVDYENLESDDYFYTLYGTTSTILIQNYDDLVDLYNTNINFMYTRYQQNLEHYTSISETEGTNYTNNIQGTPMTITLLLTLHSGDVVKFKYTNYNFQFKYVADEDIIDGVFAPSLNEIGLENTNTIQKYGFFGSIKRAFNDEVYMGSRIFEALGTLFTKEGLSSVSGIVGMYNYSKEVATHGFFYYVYFLSLISVNLGIMNLLPFPALDGGRILLTIIESITKKKTPAKVEGIINTVGFAILIGLMVLVTFKDVKGCINTGTVLISGLIK